MFKKFYLTKLSILILIIIAVWVTVNKKYYKKDGNVIEWDIISYYSYLPAYVIYDDVTLQFIKKDKKQWASKFWPKELPNGKYIIKTSMGLSFLYSPFFLIAHLQAKNSSEYLADGYSKPYRKMLVFSIIFYYLIGLIFIFYVLKNWFSDKVIAITLFCIGLGTNLYWYSTLSSTPMSHIYSFTLFAIALFFTIKWYKKQSLINSFLLGFLFGLISLIRPTNIIIILIFVLWDIKSFSEFKNRLELFLNNYLKIILIIVSFFIVWFPQLYYWKSITDKWLFFSYGQEENFFFLTPEIINGLFSYRNGWLVYTPIMFFALYGIYLCKNYLKNYYIPILIFTVFNIYIILSWWCWWYVGFGNRAFVDSYSLLSIPLALSIDRVLNLKIVYKVSALLILGFLIFLNIIQNYQYLKSIIHFDAMNKNAYWNGFLKLSRPDSLTYLLTPPDYEMARKGFTIEKPSFYERPGTPFQLIFNEISCDCERKDFSSKWFLSDNVDYYKFYCGGHNSTELSKSGSQSIKLTKDFPYGLEFKIKNIQKFLKLQISVWRYGGSGLLVVSDTESKSFYEASKNIIEKDNKGWEKIVLKIEMPEKMNGKDLKIYVWNNQQKDEVFFDDISIKYVEN